MSNFFVRTITALLLILYVGGAYVHSTVLFSFFLAALFVFIVIFEWSLLVKGAFGIRFCCLSLVYPGVPIVGLWLLNYRYRSASMLLPLYPILTGWTADTCGYLVGALIGKHKIAPFISPGKSWEGLGGGVVGVFILNLLIIERLMVSPFTLCGTRYFVVAFISVLQVFSAFLGGMFVSFLKRKRGLKDTGTSLPGHGGLLDRFDSVFFTTGIIWLLIAFGSFC